MSAEHTDARARAMMTVGAAAAQEHSWLAEHGHLPLDRIVAAAEGELRACGVDLDDDDTRETVALTIATLWAMHEREDFRNAYADDLLEGDERPDPWPDRYTRVIQVAVAMVGTPTAESAS